MFDYTNKYSIFVPEFSLTVYEGYLKKEVDGARIQTRNNSYRAPKHIIKFIKYGATGDTCQMGVFTNPKLVESIGTYQPKPSKEVSVLAPYKYVVQTKSKVTLQTLNGDIYDFFEPHTWILPEEDIDFRIVDELSESDIKYRKSLIRNDYNKAEAIRREDHMFHFGTLIYG